MIKSVTETTLAVSVEEAKSYGRITTNDEDDLVASLLRSAQSAVEDYTGRAAGEGTFLYVAPRWSTGQEQAQGTLFPAFRPAAPREIVLGRSPLISVETVQYLAPGSSELATLPATEYFADTYSLPGRVVFRSGANLPDVDMESCRPDVVQVAFTAGMSNPLMRQAILWQFVNLYENRSPVVTGTIATELPLSVRNLLRSLRIETPLQP